MLVIDQRFQIVSHWPKISQFDKTNFSKFCENFTDIKNE